MSDTRKNEQSSQDAGLSRMGSSEMLDKSSCDECGKPVFKKSIDASRAVHRFCKECWEVHKSIPLHLYIHNG